MPSFRDWVVFLTLPVISMLLSYYTISIGNLLPLIQQYFAKGDSETAVIKTFGAVAHASAYASMWLFGDFLPKKMAFLLSVSSWILFSFATTLVNSNQFWLFVLLRALSTLSGEVFRILITVLQAEHFKDNYLTAALTANIVGNNFASVASSTVNSIFVAKNSGWKFAVVIGPALAVPFLVASFFVLRRSDRQSLSSPKSILLNALSLFRIPSYFLMVVSQSITMFYSFTLSFWSPTMILYSMEAHPDVFLGLSYPVVSSLIANISFVSMMIAAFAVPFATQYLESCSGICGCCPSAIFAIPLAYATSVGLEALSYILQVTMITTNFYIYAASYFFDGFAGTGTALTELQIVLATTPASQRASALALLRLAIAIGDMPSGKIIGALSDYFRGDSSTSQGRLEALQSAFLYTWILPFISMILALIMLRYYKKDVKSANENDQMESEESSPLISTKSSVN